MATTGGAPAKRKGTRGEYLAVELLDKIGLSGNKRGYTQRWGVVDADVTSESLPCSWIEVKSGYNKRAREVYDFIEQAQREAEGTPREGMVLYKADNKPFLFIADPEYILPILAKHQQEQEDYLI